MGHFYTQDGTPMYEVPNVSSGGTRSTTIKDARKLSLVPSVTTITHQLAKDGLDRWKIMQGLEAAAQDPYLEFNEHSLDAWKNRVYKKAENNSGKASKRGTEIHDILEEVYKGQGLLPAHHELIVPVLDMVETIGLDHTWIPEESFCHEGYGGKVDLHSKYELGVILDFKTKDTDNEKKLVAYIEHGMQLVSYRYGLGLPHAECYNLFVATGKPGLVKLVKWEEEDLQKCWKMFKLLRDYWYLANNMEYKND